MRIFIDNVDSYVGKALCSDLRKVVDHENRIFGTMSDDVANSTLAESLGVKRVITRSDARQYVKDVISCSLIVYNLHSANQADVEKVIKELKVAKLEHDTIFVLISSVSVWAKTRKEYVAIQDTEDADAEDDEEQVKDVKVKPKELKDADLERRIPSAAYEAWKYLETLALSLSSMDKVRPHVVGAGILYGNGETTFNELFKAAWLTQPTQAIVEPGTNYIPCVHVRDVARLVRVIATDNSVGRYLIAVDKARLTQAEIVQGVVNQMSNKKEVPTMSSLECEFDYKDDMRLDLIMEPSAPMRSKDFDWWCKRGLVANIEKVAAEFCKWRNLRPIKMVVIGPPGAGAERLCARAAERYLHKDPPHLTFDQIVKDAMREPTEAAARLRRKVEKVAATPGAKLPLRLRTRLLKARLLSNVCRYRGYVLEGYPQSCEEAEALFTEVERPEGEEPPPEEQDEEEDEDEEEAVAPPAGDGDEAEEEDEEGGARRKLSAAVAPEFVVVLRSAEERCKNRIFSGDARGASTEEEFLRGMAEYRRENLAEDGSPGTSDFFADVAGVKVLHVDVDANNEEEVFSCMQVYMESKGQFFNYLRSGEELAREQADEIARQEEEADSALQTQQQEQRAREEAKRLERGAGERARLRRIAEGEAELLANEARPLRQYLMMNVVPTLTEGLMEVCKVTPDDPIEYLAEYLFAHAQDIAPQLGESST